MATQYTPILQLALPVTGELNGTWGEVVNDNITSMVEEAIAGLATISTWTANAHTLTTANGTTDEARCSMLVAQDGAGGTALTGAGQIICPSRTKLFVLQNSSSYAVTLKTAAGTGIAVASGDTAFLFCDSTNVNACVTQIINGHITGNLTVDGNANIKGNTTLGDAVGDTVTVNGTTTFTNANPTLSQGTANRVLFLNASKVISDAAGLTWDGTTLTATKLAGAFNGTVGATTPSTGVFTQVDITAQGDLRLQDAAGGEYVALQAPTTLASSYTLTMPVDDGTNGQALITDGSGNLSWSTAASGDVYGPASATDTAVALFDGTTGKLLKNSVMTIASDGASVLSVNSASAGLRITQIGAGNALVVEDSANPDSTPFIVDTAGRVGIGGSPYAGVNLYVVSPITGNTSSYEQINAGSVSSDVTAYAGIFESYPATQAASFTLGQLTHFGAGQNTIGAGSTVTNQYGFYAKNTLTGATNNFGFYSDIAAASNRYNFYAVGTADNFFNGKVGVGAAPIAGSKFTVAGSTTEPSSSSVLSYQTLSSASTSSWNGFATFPSTQAASFTLPVLRHYSAGQGTIGAGSTVTSQYGFNVDAGLTGATNNYGFYSSIAAGANRYNLYMQGSADNYMAGGLGIGSLVGATQTLKLGKNLTGAVAVFGILNQGTVQSDVTSAVYNNYSQLNTAATSFTLSNYYHNIASQGTIGAGSTVTNQYGFFADSTLTGATNNFGFYANIAAGANRYNLCMNGTAYNLLVGNTAVGSAGALSYAQFSANGNLTGASYGAGIISAGVIKSDATSARQFQSAPYVDTSAAITTLYGYLAGGAGLGSGASITTQYGYFAGADLTVATTNIGFASNIPAAANRYNLYLGGSADNYMAGSLGIGGLVGSSTTLLIAKNVTGAVASYSTNAQYTVQSDVTTSSSSFRSSPSTAASAFTLANMYHFISTQGTVGAGSSITNQYGNFANSTLTGATNNYGFYSAIASGSGRYNFYASGTADNYFAGRVGIGSTPFSGATLTVSGLDTTTTVYAVDVALTIPSTATAGYYSYLSYPTTAAAAFTVSKLAHFEANAPALGAGSAVTNQYGFSAQNGLTTATNNYGFYGNIAAGANRYNLYMNGTADNYFAGRVGIFSTPNSNALLTVSGNVTGGTTAYGIIATATVMSDVTTLFCNVPSYVVTQATSFTLGELRHFQANQGPLGAGSTVTTQIGYSAQNSLTGATNNYGFYSAIASGSGRYNFYAAGSADNYFAGIVSVGSTLIMSNASPLIAVGSAAVSTGDCHIEVGAQRTGNGNSYIDFIGDTTYTDYGLRLMRQNGGVNANTQLVNRGTGTLYVEALDAGSVALKANGIDGVFVSSSGTVKNYSTISVGNATPASTGAGITFPATQSASSNANTLDDYEEGTWTPVLTGSSGATGQTYIAQDGQYTKIGNVVTIRGYVRLSAKGTISGTYTVMGGLPFTVASTSYPGGITCTFATSFASNVQTINGYANATTTQIWMCGSATTGVDPLNNLNASVIGDSTYIIFHGHYYI